MMIGSLNNYSSYGTSAAYGNYGYGNYGNSTVNSQTSDGKQRASAIPDENVKAGRKSSPNDCQTCKERKYKDGSNENNVSFKSPGHVSPQASAAAVRAHEQQHVNNAYEKAASGNGQVKSATVTMRTAVCPECGTTYVAGGETRTAIAYAKEQPKQPENPYQKNQKALDALRTVGSNIDYAA